MTPTLFQALLGASFYSLAPAVRALHDVRGRVRYAGRATIARGRNPLGRHVGGPGNLPEAGLPALHPLARALRRQSEPEPVAAVDQRRGLFDHALRRLAIHRDHAQALEQPRSEEHTSE